MEHILTDDCWCQPVSQPVKRDDGSVGWVVTHRDRLIETATRAVLAKHYLADIHPKNVQRVKDQCWTAVDALAPVLADRDKRKLREGRNLAAEAIEADWIGLARSAVAPVLDRLDVVAHNPIQGEAMHKVIGWEVANAAARLARGGSTDE